jgi:Zn-dependent peptidase ImmA (M78 family)/transcriptional regulator with XRE-family HTH domain
VTAKMSSADAAALFDGPRLAMARQLAGLRKSELAKLVNKSATAVAGWESGEKRPAAGTVAELALALGVDAGFFAVRQEDVSALSGVPHFRSLRSTSQLSRDQAFAYGRLALDIVSNLDRHIEFPEVDVPQFPVEVDATDCDGPEQAAGAVRSMWGIGQGPVRHVVRTIENRGVLVVFSPPQTAAVDAYSFNSQLRPVVVLNAMKRDYYRQRFDVAHELGHLVMHGDAEPGGRIVEEQANRFAAELLMPAHQIQALLPVAMGAAVWASLAKLKEHWGVSMQALLFRARQLGRLGDVSYRNAMTTISSRGWRRAEPGFVEVVEQPSLLPRALELLQAEGIGEDALIAQCRIPPDLFRAATARTPALPEAPGPGDHDGAFDAYNRRVVSLLPALSGSRHVQSSTNPERTPGGTSED